MAKKPKTDQLSVVGLVSAILRNSAQQRSLARTNARRAARRDARRTPEQREAAKKAAKKQKKDAKKANKDTRSQEEIGTSVDTTRDRLIDTVDALKYDLDVPARLTDARDAVAAKVPREFRGELQARVAAAVVLVVGWGALVWTAIAGRRRER